MIRLLRAVASLSPRTPDEDAELESALATLNWQIDGPTTTAAADGVALLVLGGTVSVCLALSGAFLLPSHRAPAPGFLAAILLVGAVSAAGAWWAVAVGPVHLAEARRRRALGAAPWLICRAAMRVRITPTVEAGAAFASNDSEDLLSRRLAAHVRRARGTPQSGFEAFYREWNDRLPALGRAIRAIETATTGPRADRDEAVERALETVLEGTRHRAASDADSLHGPVTALYAFGVLLPLALVAALPAARVAGVPVTVPVLVATYDLLLPLALLVGASWLVSRRPVAFPPTPVPRSHPDVPDGNWRPVAAGLLAGAVAGVAAGRLVATWSAPVAAVGVGLGTGLVTRFRHERAVRQRVRAVEADLPAALDRVGRAVANGRPVEMALETARSTMDGATATVFADAAGRIRRLSVGVRDAFLGEYGALDSVPSSRAAGVADLLATAAREGEPAGDALVAAADHLGDLRAVERDTRRAVRRATATMGNTAAVFAPLVGGVTVALAGRIGGSGLGEGVPTPAIGLAVGCYVVLLAWVLTALATGLERGFDRALVGYRVGAASIAATLVYLVAVVGGRLVA